MGCRLTPAEERNCHSWEVYKYPRNMSQEYQKTKPKAFLKLPKPF